MPEPKKAQRAIASDVSLQIFGTVFLPVDIVSARRSDEIKKEMVCPTCSEAHKLSQRYHCTENEEHGPFTSKNAHRAILVDGQLKKLTESEIEELTRPELPAGTAVVRVFPAADVERETMPGGSIYRIRPRVGAEAYALIVELVESTAIRKDNRLAFCCELTVRNVTKLYRIIARDGILTLVELIRPGEFHEMDLPLPPFEAKLLPQIIDRCDNDWLEPFDAEAFTDVRRQRAADLAERKADPNAPVPEPVVRKPEDQTASLMAMLEASIEKPKRKPAKRAAKATKKTTKKAAAKA